MTGPFGPDDAGQAQVSRDLRWPAGLSPGCSDVWACSELAVLAASPVVFSRLVTVSRWNGTSPASGMFAFRMPAADT